MTITLIVLSALLVWGAVIYNRLVGDKNRVMSAWSDIDVQLKRRHDLIPKIVEAVRRYAAYESATLTEVIELRNRSRQSDSVAEVGGVESALAGKVQNLVALAEAYPDLKADDAFLTLQKDLTDVENTIQYAPLLQRRGAFTEHAYRLLPGQSGGRVVSLHQGGLLRARGRDGT
jgi:LemA protein